MANKNLKSRRVFIKAFSKDNEDFLQLYVIYKDTIDSSLTYATFQQLYYSENLVLIDLTIFSYQNESIGFSAAFFYSSILLGKPSFTARSATALIKDFQGKGLHNKFDLYLKFIGFALNHPLKPLWVSACIVNAFIFNELCRYIPVFFPRPGMHAPENIKNIMDEILSINGNVCNKMHSYSVSVPIQVNFNKELIDRIYNSDDSNVKWYLKENPGFLEKHGLMIIIRVSLMNIFGTIIAFIKRYCNNKLLGLFLLIRNLGSALAVVKIGVFKKTIWRYHFFREKL